MLIVSLKVIWQNVSVLRNSSVALILIKVEFDELKRKPDDEIGWNQTNSDYAELRLGLNLGDAKFKSNVGWDRLLVLCCCWVEDLAA